MTKLSKTYCTWPSSSLAWAGREVTKEVWEVPLPLSSPHGKVRTTAILSVVRVSALSVQMVVALPMVYQACGCLTRLWSAIVFLTG